MMTHPSVVGQIEGERVDVFPIHQAQESDVANTTENAIRFGDLLQTVSRLRRVVMDREFKPLGITRSHWWVLCFLARRDGMTQTALAADLDLTKVAIGGLLHRMEAAGFVQRRLDDRDARIRRVYLSRGGIRLMRDIRMEIERIEAQILGPNTDAEIQVATRTLHRMKTLLLRNIGECKQE